MTLPSINTGGAPEPGELGESCGPDCTYPDCNCAEQARVAQDLAYMAARDSGEIERRQIAATSAMETQLSMWRCNGGM
jgi:hypothetical protein